MNPQRRTSIEIVALEDISYWDGKVDQMAPEDFFAAIHELETVQPRIYLYLRMLRGSVNDELAYISLLRFFYIVWKSIESTDARARTQEVTLEGILHFLGTRRQMLEYLGQEEDREELTRVLSLRLAEHRQGALIGYLVGGILSEDDLFPIPEGTRHLVAHSLAAIVEAFDAELG